MKLGRGGEVFPGTGRKFKPVLHNAILRWLSPTPHPTSRCRVETVRPGPSPPGASAAMRASTSSAARASSSFSCRGRQVGGGLRLGWALNHRAWLGRQGYRF